MNPSCLPTLPWPRFTLVVLATVGMTFSGCQPEDAAGKPVRLRMAHIYDVTAPTHAYGTAHLAERLEQATDSLQVTVYPSGQLGTEAELLEQIVAGELDMGFSGPSFLGMWHPPLGVLDSAFVARDLDHLLEIARGQDLAPHWDKLREEYGVRVLATWAYGSRHLTSNVPIRHPDDLKGFRLRLPATKIFQACGAALGASPMPISFAEVYLALQQGIADGQENPVPVIKAMGFHEVQKYLNLSGHIQASVQFLINERTWQRLDAGQQEVLLQVVNELGDEVYRGTVADEQKLIEEWRADGTMEIIEGVDVDAFRKRSREHFSSGFAFSKLYNQITAEPDDARIGEQDVNQ